MVIDGADIIEFAQVTRVVSDSEAWCTLYGRSATDEIYKVVPQQDGIMKAFPAEKLDREDVPDWLRMRLVGKAKPAKSPCF